MVATDNHPIYGMSDKHCSYMNGHIKHYITKSWEDWVKRLKRGNVTKGLRTVDTFFDFNPDMAYMKEELTKNLNYKEFPSINKTDEKWDGDL